MKIMVLIPPSRFSRNVARDLIWGCWCKGKRIAGTQFDPISQCQMATVLKNDGHQVTLNEAAGLGKTWTQVIEEGRDFDWVIVLTNSVTINEDATLMKQMKDANPRLRSIVYGNHPSFYPKDTVAKDGIDFAIHREAEWAVRDLLRAIGKGADLAATVRGASWQENGEFVTTDPYPFLDNLDELPIPDRSMMNRDIVYFNPIVKRMPFTTMTTSRGCPAKCNYCSAPPFYGRIYRVQSAKRVVDEMEQCQKFGYREIFFRDEVFTCKKSRTTAICEEILRRGVDLTWIVSSRVDTIDKETMKIMKRAGCHMLRFGVESGSDVVLKNIEKGATVERARQSFAWARETGMDIHAHCMVGMPGETEDTMRQTLDFILEVEPTTMTCGITTPYPGTPMFEKVLSKFPEIGDGSQWDLSRLHTNGFHSELFTEVPADRLSQQVRKVYRTFYMRPSYIWKTMRKCNSADELRRVALAGAQVMGFIQGED